MLYNGTLRVAFPSLVAQLVERSTVTFYNNNREAHSSILCQGAFFLHLLPFFPHFFLSHDQHCTFPFLFIQVSCKSLLPILIAHKNRSRHFTFFYFCSKIFCTLFMSSLSFSSPLPPPLLRLCLLIESSPLSPFQPRTPTDANITHVE